MRFVKILIPLVLCLAAILGLNLWSTSNRQQHKLHGLSSSPLLLFSVFNAIIITIIVGNYKPASEEVDGFWPIFLPLYEEEDAQYDTRDYIEDDEEAAEEYWGSDGYDEGDDDILWQDEEEDNDDLDRRIESFTAKVNEERRKERPMEIYRNQL